MARLNFKKRRFRTGNSIITIIIMPIIAILVFLDVLPLDPIFGWVAIAAFVIALVILITKKAQSGANKDNEDNAL